MWSGSPGVDSPRRTGRRYRQNEHRSSPKDASGTFEPVLRSLARCYIRPMSYGTCVNGTLPMSYDIYVNGEYADYFGSATTWDDAARFIKRTTPANTPLHRLA